MVPELVGVFGRTKFRKEITHGAYNRLCARRTLVAVLDCKTEIHHPLDVSAIFRQNEIGQVIQVDGGMNM